MGDVLRFSAGTSTGALVDEKMHRENLARLARRAKAYKLFNEAIAARHRAAEQGLPLPPLPAVVEPEQ